MQIRVNNADKTFDIRLRLDNATYQYHTWECRPKNRLCRAGNTYGRFTRPKVYHKDTLLYPEELDQWT